MKILKIKVENFKSYKKLDINLNNLNYIIGGNASGKSNFVNILKFFSDIVEYGIDDAILLQGGIKYLFNSNSNKKEKVLLEFNIGLDDEINDTTRFFPIEKIIYLPCEFTYHIEINPNARGDGYKIDNEKIDINITKYKKKGDELLSSGNSSLYFKRMPDKKIITNYVEDKYKDKDELINMKYIVEFMKRDGLFLKNFFSAFGIFYRYYVNKTKIYNFDVNLLKSPSSIVARSELEEDGSNLVNIIQQLLKNRAKKDKLTKIIKTILPFVDDIKVENNVNKSLFFKVKETFSKNEFPSYMLSDGTVNILAVIIALYFQNDDDIIVLEEPERNIHPKLLSTLVSLFEDVSSKKQIFITTHNPYIIKEANLQDVILVSRDEKGISNLSKPANDEKIKIFLQNDLGIDELFVRGILK